MSRVLVVDDEPDYCEHLKLYLGAQGHEVHTASTGFDAIALGLRYRPQVLIADWMLKSHVNGLLVSEALRAVDPQLKTVLMTGFASTDLRSAARRAQVLDFLEKPFDPERLDDSLGAPDQSPFPGSDRSAIGFLETDADGRLVHANERAREFLADAAAHSSASDGIAPAHMMRLTATTDRWVPAGPPETGSRWHARSRDCPETGGRFVLLLKTEELHCRNQPAMRMLLGMDDPTHSRWPLSTHVLVVDDEELIRRVVTSQLERAGCVCLAAEGAAAAMQLFERDAAIGVVVLDYDLAGEDLPALATKLRAIRPGVQLIGNSGLDREGEFAAMGVNAFLCKPWGINDLIDLLTGRLGHGKDCDS